jgi:hypothetical protein
MFGRSYFGARYFGPRYWGGGASAPATVTQVETGRWDRRKRLKTIKRSDFVHQEEYAAAVAMALAQASVPLSRVTDTGDVIGEDETDDEILLLALTRILH